MTHHNHSAAVLMTLVACLAVLAAQPAKAHKRGNVFGPAEPQVAINDPVAADGCPIESPDGLSVAIASRRGPGGDLDIWVSDRAAVDAPWAPPVQLPEPISSDAEDFCPTPLGRTLYFVSSRPAACAGANIYRSRQGLSGQWSEPELLPCAPEGPNFNDAMFSPSLVTTKRATFLFYSSPGEQGDHDIYVSRQAADGSFGPGRIVHALSNPGDDDRMPNIRALGNGKGWEVVFSSDRSTWGRRHLPSFGGQDVYRAVARKLPMSWSRPVNLGGNVNTDASETRASLSGDGQRLYFGRSGDVFVSTRAHVPHGARGRDDEDDDD